MKFFELISKHSWVVGLLGFIIALFFTIFGILLPKFSEFTSFVGITLSLIIPIYAYLFIKEKSIDKVEGELKRIHFSVNELIKFDRFTKANQYIDERNDIIAEISDLLNITETIIDKISRNHQYHTAQKLLLQFILFQTGKYKNILKNSPHQWHINLQTKNNVPLYKDFKDIWEYLISTVEKSYFTINYIKYGCGRHDSLVEFQKEIIKIKKLKKENFVRIFVFNDKNEILDKHQLMLMQAKAGIDVKFMTLDDFDAYRSKEFNTLSSYPDFMLINEECLGILVTENISSINQSSKVAQFEINIDPDFIEAAIHIRNHLPKQKICKTFDPINFMNFTNFKKYVDVSC